MFCPQGRSTASSLWSAAVYDSIKSWLVEINLSTVKGGSMLSDWGASLGPGFKVITSI